MEKLRLCGGAKEYRGGDNVQNGHSTLFRFMAAKKSITV